MNTKEIEYYMLYAQINKNLNGLFDIECPETDDNILTDKNEIIIQFKKWYDFWNSKRVNLDLHNIKPLNNLIMIKNQICEERIINIFKELDKMNLKDEFIKFME